MHFKVVLSLLIAILPVVNFGAPRPDGKAWKGIFNGKNLDGWKAPDMSYFSVEDGAITGQTTREHNPPENQFIVWQDGKVDDGGFFGFGVAGDKVAQGAHRLGAEVPAFDDVVVHELADASLFGFSVGAVDVIDHGAEEGGVGHLAADGPGFDLGTAEVFA